MRNIDAEILLIVTKETRIFLQMVTDLDTEGSECTSIHDRFVKIKCINFQNYLFFVFFFF